MRDLDKLGGHAFINISFGNNYIDFDFGLWIAKIKCRKALFG